MSIEIKQLLIKSNIAQNGEEGSEDSSELLQSMKQEILAECRRLVLELMRERGER